MPETTPNHRSLLKRATPWLLVIAVVLVAVIIINPFREFLGDDDSWAYARMVQYTLATGKYRMEQFTVVNLPVQIYLTAGVAKIFGYSLILLRCVVLAFLGLAMWSFCLLLRELGHSRWVTALMALALFASPLVLILSFAFMSDVPFIAWTLLALLLYVRGIRRDSSWLMFLGSLAAGCAVGTRQFGMAILAGLLVCWFLAKARPRSRLMLVGLAVPLLASIAQVYVGIKYPNQTQAGNMGLVRHFFESPLRVIVEEYFWRCAITTQYLGMALLPLLPLAAAVPRSFWKQRIGRLPTWTLGLLSSAAIAGALWLSSVETARPEAAHRAGLWEPLELHWVFPVYFGQLHPVMRFFDVVGILGGGVLILLVVQYLRSYASRRTLRPETLLLAGTGLCLLLLHLPFNHLNDTYIVAFLPFLLLLAAAALRPLQRRPNLLAAATAFSVLIILTLSLWMRSEDARLEAAWNSADALYHAGVQPGNMEAPYQWEKYHGAFDEWIATDPLIDFYKFLEPQRERAQFSIQLAPSPAAPPGWRLLAVRTYRNAAFRKRYILTVQRDK